MTRKTNSRCVVLTVLLTASAILGVAPLGAFAQVRMAASERDTLVSSISTNQAIGPRFKGISNGGVSAPLARQVMPQPSPAPRTTTERLIALFFDIASMQPDDLLRARAAGVQFVNETMTNADSVAVVTNVTGLSIVKDFTSSREELRTAFESLQLLTRKAPDGVVTSSDTILRVLTTLCAMLAPFEQRKTMVYFGAGSNSTSGTAELGASSSACNRAAVVIYRVDARGLPFAVANVF